MKHIFLLSLIIFFSAGSFNNLNGQERHPLSAGTEIDVLPFATGGYYLSAWGGVGNLRLRVVITKVYPPGFVMPDGMTNLKTDAFAVIADYFPWRGEQKQYSGLWLGAGIEYWMNNIEEKGTGITGEYNNLILTAGTGYIIPVYSGLYINPWAAIHFPVTGMADKMIGSTLIKQKKLMAEVSLKIGWQF